MRKIILLNTLVTILTFLDNYGYAQSVGISPNMATPNSSALLDIDVSGMTPKKGLLIPRVQLTSTTDVATILSPATSLMVYNNASTGTAPNNVKPGYYYYNGTKWVDRIGATSAFVNVYNSTGAILTCNVPTKIVFDTEVKDVDGIYDNVTGKLNLPAGIWEISASAYSHTAGAYNNSLLNLIIYKNNASFKWGPTFNVYNNSAGIIIDAIVRSNGTDYFEIYGSYANCGGNATFTGGSASVLMQAVKLSD